MFLKIPLEQQNICHCIKSDKGKQNKVATEKLQRKNNTFINKGQSFFRFLPITIKITNLYQILTRSFPWTVEGLIKLTDLRVLTININQGIKLV